MPQETTILDIDFGDLLDRLVKVKNATAELREENEKLKQSTTEDAEEIEKNTKKIADNEAQIRALNKEKTALNKTVDNSIAQRKAETGSIEANRLKLSQLTAEYIKLSKPTKEQTAAIKDLSDKLKEQEGAIGNTSRNVGNYQSAIQGALKNVKLFGVNIGDTLNVLKQKKGEFSAAAKGIGDVNLSLSGASNGLKLFRLALISTGIGAIIVALGFFTTLLAKSETGMALFNKVTTITGAIMSTLVKRVEALAKGIAFFIDGEWEKSVEAVGGAFKGVGDEIDNVIRASAALADAQEELEDAEIGFIKRRSEIRAQIEDLKDVANDETIVYEERKKALQDALNLQAELTGKEAEIAKFRIETAEQEFLLSAQTDDDRRKFEESKALAFEDERSRSKEKIKLENELSGLAKKNASDIEQQQKQIESERKKREKEKEEQDKKNKEAIAELQKEITDGITNEIFELQRKAEEFRKAGAEEADVLKFIAQETARIEEQKSDIIIAEIDKRGKAIEKGNVVEILSINKKYNALILAAGTNAAEVARLEKEKQQALLEIQREALQQQLNQLQAQFEAATASSEGGLIAEALGLTDEGRKELESRINEAKSRIEELGFTIGKLSINVETGEPQDLLHALGLDEAGIERFNESIGFISSVTSDVSGLVSDAAENRIHELEREKEAAIALAGDSTTERQKIEESYNAKIESEKKKAFEQTKKIKVTESIISTALATINAYNAGVAAAPGPAAPIIGALFAAIAAGIGIAQTAIIAKSKYALGGEVINVGGRSHAEGGTTYAGEDGNAFEVERGEKIFVLKQNASEFINKYSTLNEMFGGNRWTNKPTRYAALGGNLATSLDGGLQQRDSRNSVNQQIDLAEVFRNLPTPVVKVTEINKVQRGVNQSVAVSEL